MENNPLREKKIKKMPMPILQRN